MTIGMKRKLRERGYTEDAINVMEPKTAWEILNQVVSPGTAPDGYLTVLVFGQVTRVRGPSVQNFTEREWRPTEVEAVFVLPYLYGMLRANRWRNG